MNRDKSLCINHSAYIINIVESAVAIIEFIDLCHNVVNDITVKKMSLLAIV